MCIYVHVYTYSVHCTHNKWLYRGSVLNDSSLIYIQINISEPRGSSLNFQVKQRTQSITFWKVTVLITYAYNI